MTTSVHQNSLVSFAPSAQDAVEAVVVRGDQLSIEEVVRVARHRAPIRLTDDHPILARIEASRRYVCEAVENELPIYGVTTSFGGMSDKVISNGEAIELQNNAIWQHKTGAGKPLPAEDVRAAMVVRMNSHARGYSGLRLELIRRFETFLNAGVTPHVPLYGSIGASGDLVPLTYITGALIGADPAFIVDFDGEETDALTALEQLDLTRLTLEPKEGLAMINGSAVSTAIATNCVYDAQTAFAVAVGAHALALQALYGTDQSFHPFIHANKPHPGQVWLAAEMLRLLDGSRLVRHGLNGQHEHRENDLIQDRYSLRCLPQYLGPILDGLRTIAGQVETEINCVSDNPLIDPENWTSYHGGNFLSQYIGMGMDQLRYNLGLLAKHLDVQIALLMEPAFNNGLPPSLVGNPNRKVNLGLKGVQLAGNSMMPLLTYLGNPLVTHFPSHAEQFNQNVNSQSFGSANFARQAVDLLQQYLAIALIAVVQGVDLRTYKLTGQYDARECLSPESARLYEAVRAVVGVPPSAKRPYVWNDNEQFLDAHIAAIAEDIDGEGRIVSAVKDSLQAIRE